MKLVWCLVSFSSAQIHFISPKTETEIIQNDVWRQGLDALWPAALWLALMGGPAEPAAEICRSMVKPDLSPLESSPTLIELLRVLGLLDEIGTENRRVSDIDMIEILKKILGSENIEALLGSLPWPSATQKTDQSFNPLDLLGTSPELLRLLKTGKPELPTNPLAALLGVPDLPGAQGTLQSTQSELAKLLGKLDPLGLFNNPGLAGAGFAPGWAQDPGRVPMGPGMGSKYWKRSSRSRHRKKKRARPELSEEFVLAIVDQGQLQEVYDNLLTPFWYLEKDGEFYHMRKQLFQCLRLKKDELGKGQLLVIAIESAIDDRLKTEPIEEMHRAGLLDVQAGKIVPSPSDCIDSELELFERSLIVKKFDWTNVVVD
eukprot:Gregarina_sp_Poly_1__5905@NODE_310_length_9629_cov_213_427526_g267_i0_p3_GENE_NODE_310_length_9629_cov_213_427526_g267_i0NODE_310_length_9629_cov_213_427526_g267_i0_p3_ORF_typecomplete_len373_score55_44_NODE_310_length_9629_cov_213_427526_g267_i025523670